MFIHVYTCLDWFVHVETGLDWFIHVETGLDCLLSMIISHLAMFIGTLDEPSSISWDSAAWVG